MSILNAIFPVFVLLVLGNLLKRAGLTNEPFLRTSDRLVYYIFFPAMLFWKIGRAAPDLDNSLRLCIGATTAILLVYLLSLLAIKVFHISRYQAGAFSQACYRFNTYIGMAVIMNALGETGVRYFGILIGFVIPIINVLALSTLIWHSGQKGRPIDHTLRLIKALICNPLIIGCVAGLFFSRTRLVFPLFINTTFALMTSVTMPLALISIGGSLSMKGLEKNYQPALTALILKIIILPVIGYVLLKAFSVSGTPFKTGMIFFTLPTSTAIYVLSAQLNADTQLASAAIMLSTLVSFASLSLVLLL